MSNEKKVSRTIVGKVISDKMDKTRVITVERREKDPIYGKYVQRSSKLHAHDEKNISKMGDTVLIKQSRPLSRTKNWELVKVLEKAVNL